MNRWRFFFWVRTCIKPNLVLSEISEMRWRVRWRDEENFFWSKHVSSQIWCYLKLVRWRDEEWDEEMKKNFLGSKHVSSQIWCRKFFPLLGQIWCYLKLVRWRDEEWDEQMNRWRKFFGSEHVSSQIWCYLKLVRWRVKSEQMKKIFFWSEHVSSQIWCYLKLVRWRDEEWDEEMKKKFFWVRTCIKPNLVLSEISEMKRWRVRWRDEENFLGPNMYQAKSGVIWN